MCQLAPEHHSDIRVRLRGVRHGQHLVHHPAVRREALGHLLGLQGQDGEGGGHIVHVPPTSLLLTLPQIKMSVIKTITGMFWAVSIVLATLPLLGYGRYVYEVSSAGARVSMVTTGWPGLPLHQHRGPARHRPRESRLLLARVLRVLHPAQHHHPPLLHLHHISIQVTVWCALFEE